MFKALDGITIPAKYSDELAALGVQNVKVELVDVSKFDAYEDWSQELVASMKKSFTESPARSVEIRGFDAQWDHLDDHAENSGVWAIATIRDDKTPDEAGSELVKRWKENVASHRKIVERIWKIK